MDPHIPPGPNSTGHSNADPSLWNNTPITANGDAFFAAATTRNQIHSLRDIGLRLNSRRNAASKPIRGVASACIDEDDSGNYDPNESRTKSLNAPQRRTKKAKREDGQGEPNQERKTRRGKQAGYSLPVTIVFSSQSALDYLRSITPDPFEDSEDSLDSSSESMGTDDDILPSRRLVKKPERFGGVFRVDGMTVDQLTTSHPQHRGCKACFESGDDGCSLIEDSYAYPCIACDDAGINCELITSPEFKKVCEHCKKKRISCSYKVDGGKDVDSCTACKEAKIPCYAGPLRASHAKRFQGSNPKTGVASRSKTRGRSSTCPSSSSNYAAPQAAGPQTASQTAAQATSQATSPQIPAPQIPAPQIPAPQTTAPQPPSTQPPATSTQSVPVPSQPATTSQTTVPIAFPRPALAPERQFVACNQCRTEGQRCSLKRNQTGPCSNCRTNNEACEFVLIPPPNKRPAAPPIKDRPSKRTSSNKKASSRSKSTNRNLLRRGLLKRSKKGQKRGSGSAKPPSRLPPPQPRSTQGITHITIGTSFAHPIVFNHIPAPDGRCPCSWCASPFFGLFGHGERKVEVIPWPGGHGYEEIGLEPTEAIVHGYGRDGDGDLRGHNQLGEERSRMCVSCTFERVRIMVCEAHEMGFIEDVLDPGVFQGEEWERAIEAFEKGDGEGSGLVLGAKWCSVCPAFAEYRCVAAQEDGDIDGEVDIDIQGKRGRCGCGLLLCENCKDLLGKIEREKKISHAAKDMNVLDQLVQMVGGDKFHYPIGVRADVSFLTTDGELNSRLGQGFGEDMDSEDPPSLSAASSQEEIWNGKEEDVSDGSWRRSSGVGKMKMGEKLNRGTELVVISDDED